MIEYNTKILRDFIDNNIKDMTEKYSSEDLSDKDKEFLDGRYIAYQEIADFVDDIASKEFYAVYREDSYLEVDIRRKKDDSLVACIHYAGDKNMPVQNSKLNILMNMGGPATLNYNQYYEIFSYVASIVNKLKEKQS